MDEIVAYHEAGHALMAFLCGAQVKLVTLVPENDDGPARQGDTQVVWRRKSLGELEFARRAVQVCLGGPVAEMIYSGEPYHPGLITAWASDWQTAWEVAAARHASDRQRLRYLEQTCVELHRRLRETMHWAAVAALADHLLAHEFMEGAEVAEVVGAWLR